MPIMRAISVGNRRRCAAAVLVAAAIATEIAAQPKCDKTIYLSFDTGNMAQAELIAQILNAQQVKASFFLANEKTVRGDYALDASWQAYWRARVAEGHVFGSHTFDHVRVLRDLRGGLIEVKADFGAFAGKKQAWDQRRFCAQIEQVQARFLVLTGAKLDPIWRAPGGRLSANAKAFAAACGYTHIGWSQAGFSGDELPSEEWPNRLLLQRMLRDLRDGDIVLMHLGIWSRRQAWAPENLEPLITGLKQRGFCFATLPALPALQKGMRD